MKNSQAKSVRLRKRAVIRLLDLFTPVIWAATAPGYLVTALDLDAAQQVVEQGPRWRRYWRLDYGHRTAFRDLHEMAQGLLDHETYLAELTQLSSAWHDSWPSQDFSQIVRTGLAFVLRLHRLTVKYEAPKWDWLLDRLEFALETTAKQANSILELDVEHLYEELKASAPWSRTAFELLGNLIANVELRELGYSLIYPADWNAWVFTHITHPRPDHLRNLPWDGCPKLLQSEIGYALAHDNLVMARAALVCIEHEPHSPFKTYPVLEGVIAALVLYVDGRVRRTE